MKPESNEVRWRELRLGSGQPIHALRLVLQEADPTLLVSSTVRAEKGEHQTVLSARSLAESGGEFTPVLAVSHLLPPPPGWDASWDREGGVLVAHELQGGALGAVFLRAQKAGGAMNLTRRHPFDSFSHPRFARGLAGSPRLLSMILDKKEAVLFELPAAGGDLAPYRKLGGCVESLVVGDHEGLRLLCKSVVPGPARCAVAPGLLSHVRVGEDRKPAGTPTVLLGGRPVFEFDAEIVGDRLLVFATTVDGPRLEAISQSSEPLKLSLPPATSSVSALGNPAVLVTPAQVHVALLESAGSPAARVRVARIPVESLR